MKKLSERKRLAIHESAHAMLCWIFDKKILSVTIEKSGPRCRFESGNMTLYAKNYHQAQWPIAPLETFTREILIDVAGYIAEKMYLAGPPGGFDIEKHGGIRPTRDGRLVYALAALACGGRDDQAWWLVVWLHERASDILRQHWGGVLRLAGALMKQTTLSGADVVRTIESARNRRGEFRPFCRPPGRACRITPKIFGGPGPAATPGGDRRGRFGFQVVEIPYAASNGDVLERAQLVGFRQPGATVNFAVLNALKTLADLGFLIQATPEKWPVGDPAKKTEGSFD